MQKYVACVILLSCSVLSLRAQNTVGLLSYDLEQVFDGYHLLFPHNQSTVYLLDNCGAVVHTWDDDIDIRPGNTVYLMENGDLVKCSRHNQVTDDVIWAGGGGEFVEIRDWENNLKWRFILNDSTQRIHHDIEPLPNGNILMIVWERKLYDEAVAAGRDTALLSRGELWSEAIIEVRPVNDTFEIVWEWHVWDHLIQDYDPTQANFGVVADHPELVDINYADDAGASSWMHMNAIDYNPVLRQIVVSVPTYSEIWIIDHTTTTAEAAGHSGGMSDRGGDLMFRWGNPAVYDRGATEDQQLFFQHDVHWIDAHLDATHPEFGKLAVFNNRVGPDSSEVAILQPIFLDYAWMYGMEGDETFLPADFDWTYSHPEKEKMSSDGLSSVQFLPNDNILICSGRNGYVFEINKNEEIVWEYEVPLSQGNRVVQGTVLSPGQNLTFRVNKYPADYPAFAGRDLAPKGYIELDPDTTFCDLPSSTFFPGEHHSVQVWPNPASDEITIEWMGDKSIPIRLYNATGICVYAQDVSPGIHHIHVPNAIPGIYFLTAGGRTSGKIVITGSD